MSTLATATSSSRTILFFLIALLPYAGCRDGKFPVRPARGKVVCGDQPVTVGSITFTPIGDSDSLETGKAASAALGPDGTFVLTTFDRFDGAIVGKHRVQYNSPEADGSNEETEDVADPDAPSAMANASAKNRAGANRSGPLCIQKEEIIVEVNSSGENEFTIQLSPAGKGV